MEKKTSNTLRILLSLAVAAALLWVSFKEVQWSEFFRSLEHCKWHWAALSVLLGALALWLRGLRWRELLLPIDPSTSRVTTFNAVCISYVANMLIPRAGELLRGSIIARHSARRDGSRERLASYDKVLGTVIIERIWDTLVLAGIAALVLLAARSGWGGFLAGKIGSFRLPSPLVLLGAGSALLSAVVACYVLKDSFSFMGKIWGFLAGIFSGARDSLKMKGWWKFLIHTVLIWVCYWGTSLTVILALGESIPAFASLGLMNAMFVMVVGSIASVVPVPGGFGAYHYMIGTALSVLYGIPMEQGMIYAVLSHESQTLMQIICGAACYAGEALAKDKK